MQHACIITQLPIAWSNEKLTDYGEQIIYFRQPEDNLCFDGDEYNIIYHSPTDQKTVCAININVYPSGALFELFFAALDASNRLSLSHGFQSPWSYSVTSCNCLSSHCHP